MASCKVSKISGKPFKSTFQIATVKYVVVNPKTGKLAFSFEEDDSIVDIHQCKYIGEMLNEEEQNLATFRAKYKCNDEEVIQQAIDGTMPQDDEHHMWLILLNRGDLLHIRALHKRL